MIQVKPARKNERLRWIATVFHANNFPSQVSMTQGKRTRTKSGKDECARVNFHLNVPNATY